MGINYSMLEPPLYKHQIEGIEFLMKNSGGFLAFDMGTGKTRIVLEAFKHLQQRGYKLLVICPLTLIETAWKDDIKKFTDFKMCDLHGKARFPAHIYVTNYESLLSPKKYSEIVQLVTLEKVICVLDESSRVSNHKAKTTKQLLALRSCFKGKILLSGTPNAQSDSQWWSQMAFLNPDLLHSNYYAFENSCFELVRGSEKVDLKGLPRDARVSMFKKGWKQALSEKGRQWLYSRLKEAVLWRKLDDCVDLPDEVDVIRKIDMEPEQLKAYTDMKNQLVAEIKDKQIVAQVVLTKIMKLRQITSGFAVSEDGSLAKFDYNPKLMELKDTLEEIDGQAIIFVNFKAEVAEIKSILRDECCVVDGETSDKARQIDDFKAGRKKYLIANLQSMAHGVTLVNTHYCIYFSHSYSAEDFAQSRARIRRIGQKEKCVYIHLQCRESIDEVIYKVLKRKGDAMDIAAEALK